MSLERLVFLTLTSSNAAPSQAWSSSMGYFQYAILLVVEQEYRPRAFRPKFNTLTSPQSPGLLCITSTIPFSILLRAWEARPYPRMDMTPYACSFAAGMPAVHHPPQQPNRPRYQADGIAPATNRQPPKNNHPSNRLGRVVTLYSFMISKRLKSQIHS
jgi:hypothetical protein